MSKVAVRVLIAVAVVVCALGTAAPWASASSVAEATALIKAGKMAQAAEMLEAIIAEAPDNLPARFWLGRVRLALGDLEGAALSLQTVLEAKPESVESRYWLGEVRRRQGRLSEARVLLRQVLEATPNHRQAKVALEATEAEIAERERMLGDTLPDWVLPTEAQRVALHVQGFAVTPGETRIYSSHVYDYTFSDPPTDWMPAGGLWETTNRWTCSPQWSWYGGFATDGVAAIWNKRQFVGDITVEVYAAFKMGVRPGNHNYRNPNDMNITICGDGANLDSGYSFIYGGELNSSTRIMRGTRVLAENRSPEAMLPIFEDGFPSTYEFHRRWWMLRVRKHGDLLQFYVDNKLLAEVRDPQPLAGGRIAIWSRDNGLILSRIKVYYEQEQIPRDPVPLQHLALRPVEEVTPRLATITSGSHPAVFNDFETDLGGVANRDGDQGAMVTIAAPGANGSAHCAKLINTYAGGTFAATLHAGRFDVRQLPRLSFDYRLDPDARVNLYLTVNNRPCEIAFSGPRQPAESRTMVGAIPDVEADGQWHHAEFDLLGALEPLLGDGFSGGQVSDLFIGNLNSTDYLDAGFGGNHAGTRVFIDNLALYRPGNADTVQVAAKAAGGADISGWALALDQDPGGSPPPTITSEDGSAEFPVTGDGRWFVHARPQLADGSWGATQTLAVHVDRQPPTVLGAVPDGGRVPDGEPLVIRVSDGGGVGIDPTSIRVAVGESTVEVDGRSVRFDPVREEIVIDMAALGEAIPPSGTVEVKLLAMADRNGAALSEPKVWVYRSDPEGDSAAPRLVSVDVGDLPVLLDDFETDMGEWSNWGAEGGAVLSLDSTTAASGNKSLRLYNPDTGGSFGAYIRKTAFDAGRYRIVRFAYKIPERLRADIMVHCNGERKAIHFTDNDSSYRRIGEVPNVIADNQWHVAEFNLYEMLRRDDPRAPGYKVLQMWIADTGWTSNAPGQVYHIDDFALVPIVSAAQPLKLAWQIEDVSGLAGVNWAVSEDPTTELPTTVRTAGRYAEYADPGDVDGWLHVRAVDSAGNWSATAHRRLLVDSSPPTAEQQSPAAGVRTAVSEVSVKLADAGIAGIDPSSVVLNVGGTDYTVSNSGLTYLSDRGLLLWNCERTSPGPTVFKDGQEVQVELKQAADYAGNAVTSLPSWTWVMDYSKDTTGPVIAEVDCSTHRTVLAQTFETGLEGWSNRGGAEGAAVERDTTTAASGQASVKITQQRNGGHMQALVTSKAFPADTYPVISFDYRFDKGLKLDLLLYMNGQWWPVSMTDDNAGALGRIPGMRADGNWHHASVNIVPLLRRQQRRGPLVVNAVIVGDRNSRDNPKGASAHFDNFVIGAVGTVKPVFRWTATDTTGIAGYSYVLDQEPSTEPPTTSMGTTAAKAFEGIATGLWFLHVRAVDGAGNWGPTTHYAIMHSSG